jgi:hypothetical protein
LHGGDDHLVSAHVQQQELAAVIAGNSRSKNGVASLAYDPATHDEPPLAPAYG